MQPRPAVRIRELATDELSGADVVAIRAILTAAFIDDEHGGFTEDDWQHALGGRHFLLLVDERLAGHASVVQRELHADGRPLRTGYVEAVAIDPAVQRRGFGSQLMGYVNAHVDEAFDMGALGTGSQPFYERLGWSIWRGPSAVRTADGSEQPTPDEDGYILVRRTRSSPPLDLTGTLSCESRPGDVW